MERLGAVLILSTGVLLLTSSDAGRVVSAGPVEPPYQPEGLCPTTQEQVAYLAGGRPWSWQFGTREAWVYNSDNEDLLTGPKIGRLESPGQGKIEIDKRVTTDHAWYTCVEKYLYLDAPWSWSEPAPNPGPNFDLPNFNY